MAPFKPSPPITARSFMMAPKTIIYEGKPVKIPGKELGQGDFTKIPNGLPGVGDRLPVLFTHGVAAGRLSLTQFVASDRHQPGQDIWSLSAQGHPGGRFGCRSGHLEHRPALSLMG